LRNRPLLIVLNQTTIPAVLLEIGFMTNPNEAALLATHEYRLLTAQAIVRSIFEVFEVSVPR